MLAKRDLSNVCDCCLWSPLQVCEPPRIPAKRNAMIGERWRCSLPCASSRSVASKTTAARVKWLCGGHNRGVKSCGKTPEMPRSEFRRKPMDVEISQFQQQRSKSKKKALHSSACTTLFPAVGACIRESAYACQMPPDSSHVSDDGASSPSCSLPPHRVLQDNSTTTKNTRRFHGLPFPTQHNARSPRKYPGGCSFFPPPSRGGNFLLKTVNRQVRATGDRIRCTWSMMLAVS